MIVEVMGRNSGWIAVMSGIAGGADLILIPEVPYDMEKICNMLKKRHELKKFSIVVVAEGVKASGSGKHIVQDSHVDEFGNVRLGGVGQVISEEIEKRTGIETRFTMLGHVQRGGSPTAYDRVLATRFGVAAVEALYNKEFGKMVALRSEKIITIPLEEAILTNKKVDMQFYKMAEIFFG
jgi:6-phosphofructokinase 1